MRCHLLLAALLVPLALPACTDVDDDDSAPEQPDLDTILSVDRPAKRSEILAVADEPTNTIVFFGGNDGPIVNQSPRPQFHDDTWVFEPGFGWSELSVSGPSARGRYGAAHDADGGRMLLFGGRWRDSAAPSGDDYTLFNDLWEFDFETRAWTELHDGSGTAPTGRYYPATEWDDATNTLWMYGGAANAGYVSIEPTSELWKWTAADGWEQVQFTGQAPSERIFFETTWDAVNQRLILFAGQIGDYWSYAYNDLFALDIPTLTWTELHDGAGQAPFTRMHPALQYDQRRERVVLFGGHTDIGDDNDLWVFPSGGSSWDLVVEADTLNGGLGCLDNDSEVPASFVTQDLSAPERRHRGMHAVMHDNLWIFGGMHAECSDHLDDTWRFDLETHTWHELIEARTGESCLRRDDDCDCLCL